MFCFPKDWITNWSLHLIDLLQQKQPAGGRDSSGSVERLMVACKPAATVDIQVAQFLLPHILVHVLKSQPSSHSQVMVEIEAVFKGGEGGPMAAAEENECGGVSAPRFFDNKAKMAAQTVFSVLDHLNR